MRPLAAAISSLLLSPPFTTYTPTRHEFAHCIIDACQEATTPEETASAAAAAIQSLGESSVRRHGQSSSSLPPQGEYEFDDTTDWSARGDVVAVKAASGSGSGDGRAAHTLGLLLHSGCGGVGRPDPSASASYHAAAARAGNMCGLAVLGGCIRRGVGAEREEATGLLLIRAAAAVGSPAGLNKLGVLYEEGCGMGGYDGPEGGGIAIDPTMAAKCYEQSAAAGSALGLFYHGWSLFHGVGTARNELAGLEAWKASAAKAPDDGSEEAAYQLWEEHARQQRPTTKRRDLEPTHWLRLAAQLQHAPAVDELNRWERSTVKRQRPKKESKGRQR